MEPGQFRITGDASTGALIVICRDCGDQFDGKHAETVAWRRWHATVCTGKPAETG